MASAKIKEILFDTAGELVYSEQLLEIFLALGMSLEEANVARKDYQKRLHHKIEEHNKFITSVLGENKETSALLEMLKENASKCISKFYNQTLEDIGMRSIDAILDMAGGKLQYSFQAQMILEKVAYIPSKVASEIIDDFVNGKDTSLHKLTIAIQCPIVNVSNRIIELLEEHAKDLVFENMSFVFVKNKIS